MQKVIGEQLMADYTRKVFLRSDIGPDSLTLRAKISRDGGATWLFDKQIHAIRVAHA